MGQEARRVGEQGAGGVAQKNFAAGCGATYPTPSQPRALAGTLAPWRRGDAAGVAWMRGWVSGCGRGVARRGYGVRMVGGCAPTLLPHAAPLHPPTIPLLPVVLPHLACFHARAASPASLHMRTREGFLAVLALLVGHSGVFCGVSGWGCGISIGGRVACGSVSRKGV